VDDDVFYRPDGWLFPCKFPDLCLTAITVLVTIQMALAPSGVAVFLNDALVLGISISTVRTSGRREGRWRDTVGFSASAWILTEVIDDARIANQFEEAGDFPAQRITNPGLLRATFHKKK